MINNIFSADIINRCNYVHACKLLELFDCGLVMLPMNLYIYICVCVIPFVDSVISLVPLNGQKDRF